MKKKAIGIIGGMGPLATADLFRKIVINTKAAKDQEHLRVFIDNNTEIPDRTAAILENGKDPIPQLVNSATLLEKMGADLLIIPCNTAHYFNKEIQKSVTIPVLNMIELTRESLIKNGVKKAALLATKGTIKSGIYQKVFENSCVELIVPEEDEQTVIMDLIYKGVKAGKKDYDVEDTKKVMENLVLRGGETLILGCTELPLAKDMYNLDFNTCDPTLELAKGAIIAAGGECLSRER